VENSCKNTARVVRTFLLGAFRETRGVEKKTGGWEEQTSFQIAISVSKFFYLPKPKIEENFQRHHLLINGTKRRTWNAITISTVYARSLGQFNGQVHTRWMNRLERMKGRSN
jgi:hypothetical protein